MSDNYKPVKPNPDYEIDDVTMIKAHGFFEDVVVASYGRYLAVKFSRAPRLGLFDLESEKWLFQYPGPYTNFHMCSNREKLFLGEIGNIHVLSLPGLKVERQIALPENSGIRGISVGWVIFQLFRDFLFSSSSPLLKKIHSLSIIDGFLKRPKIRHSREAENDGKMEIPTFYEFIIIEILFQTQFICLDFCQRRFENVHFLHFIFFHCGEYFLPLIHKDRGRKLFCRQS